MDNEIVQTKDFPYGCPNCAEEEEIAMIDVDYEEMENCQTYECQSCGQQWVNVCKFSYAEYILKGK